MTAARQSFRTDIQGLRALAVVPIVFLHAGFQALPGGFLGVDVFFVISGFLITRIITTEIVRDEFTFSEFYKRRAIRIFPAFVVMLVVTLVAGQLLMIDPIFDMNSLSASASAVFASNFYFWRNTDYFSPAAHIFMYLHTWSLSIEEQFYLFYPIALMMISRVFKHSMGTVIILGVAGSFVTSLIFYNHAAGWAFFLLPSRAWQLGLGAAVALAQFPTIATARGRNIVASFGFLMICASFVLIDQNWQIPAPWSLPASMGTALLLAYGEKGPTATILSLPPIAWIGAISYSLYLWHWPIIVLHHVAIGPASDVWTKLALIGASGLVAAASYYVVEQRFLRVWRDAPPSRSAVTGGAAMGALAIAALTASNLPEHWSTFPAEARRVAAYFNYAQTAESKAQLDLPRCFSGLGVVQYDSDYCTRQIPGRPTIALVGDSHAAQYSLALRKLFPKHNFIQVTAAGCHLLLNVKSDARCTNFSQLFFSTLVFRRKIDRVILVNQWNEASLGPLRHTIGFLRKRGISVSVIGPVEEFRDSAPLLLANAMRAGSIEYVEKHRLVGPVALELIMAKQVSAWGGDYYSVQDIECPDRVCRYFTADGTPIHHDYGHVTQSGAELLLSKFPKY